jgi:Co/Zn/Cd efflux system component
LQLEIIPPIVSVAILVAVTIVVTGNAVEALLAPERVGNMPNLQIMMLFSIFNLFLDAVNVFCFSKSTENLGLRPETLSLSTPKSHSSYDQVANTDDSYCVDKEEEHGRDDNEEDDTNNPNLNMCSALTHVFADTLRSLAVILASAIGLTVASVEPDKADAIAAIVVAMLIALSLVPLIQGLFKSTAELMAIIAEEASETMFAESEAELELS